MPSESGVKFLSALSSNVNFVPSLNALRFSAWALVRSREGN